MSSQPPTSSKEEATDSSTTTTGKEESEPTPKEESEPTLYEILRSSPDASRSDLKKQYVSLARVSHPDAQIGKSGSNDNENVDFQKIAEAWSTLGNPKDRRRYDRQLKAKAWGEAAQRLANDRLEQAAPVASKFMDNLAVPFLRRTSATTYAVGKAISKGIKRTSQATSAAADSMSASVNSETLKTSKNGAASDSGDGDNNDAKIADSAVTEDVNGIESTTTTAEPAETYGVQTNDDIECPVELNEQSMELQEQAKNEEEKAKTIHEELDSVKEKRLFASLQSSEHPLSSSEADEVLEKLTSNATVSFTNRSTKKAHIEKEINSLRFSEAEFTQKLDNYNQFDLEWNRWLSKQEDAKKTLDEKNKDAIAARAALASAEKKVTIASYDVKAVTNKLRGVEEEVRKSALEMDRVSTTLSRKQERVRNALKKKTELMKGGITVQYVTAEEVKILLNKESQLLGESKQIATMVARLQSRADMLKKRAEALEQLKIN